MTWDRIKKPLLVSTCIAVIAASAIWIYVHQFTRPDYNVVLHQAVGRVMAEHAVGLVGKRGKIVVITMETAKVPELRPQMEEFEKALKRLGEVTIYKTYTLDTEDKAKYGLGSGLSGRRYVRIVNKNVDIPCFVSFVGAPALTDDDIGQLKAKPKLLAESRAAQKLKPLFSKELLHVAVVARFEFPTPVKGQPRNSREWFDQRFQIVTATNIDSLPTPSAD